MTSSAPRPRQGRSAALDAVWRVRSMREQDALFGLHGALSEARRDRDHLESLDSRLDPAPDVPADDHEAVGTFLEARGALLALGSAIAAARGKLDATDAVALAARSRWQQDKTRLDAISMLMERRALELRAELMRREARDLDEIAGQRWARDEAGR